MKSQPQNPEFRNNPENFHPCKTHFKYLLSKWIHCAHNHNILQKKNKSGIQLTNNFNLKFIENYHTWIQRGWGDRGSTTTLKNHKNIGFLSNIGQDSLKNHIATKPAFNAGPSSARQQNTI